MRIIFAGTERVQPLIGRTAGSLGATQIERYATKQSAVIGNVTFTQAGVKLVRRGFDLLTAEHFGKVVLEARVRSHQECGRVGSLDLEAILTGSHLPIGIQDTGPADELYSGLTVAVLVFQGAALHEQRVSVLA